MKKEFVPYELALRMKQLGFDEKCIAYYQKSAVIGNDNILPISFTNMASDFNDYEYSKLGVPFYSAPTWQQAFRWFREKHNLRCQINYIGGLINKTTWWDISVIGHYNTDPKEWEMKYQPYEEAELACLRKLIEIVK
jgi:hypothetical protein